jgi:hypothetical protein
MDAGRVGFVSVTRRRATPHRSPDEFVQANRRAKSLQLAIPRATDAHFDRKNGRVVIDLSSGLAISFSPSDVQRLEQARASQLEQIEISPSGFGIHFLELDADVYLPSLFQGSFGSKKWMQNKESQRGKSGIIGKKVSAKAKAKVPARRKKAVRA